MGQSQTKQMQTLNVSSVNCSSKEMQQLHANQQVYHCKLSSQKNPTLKYESQLKKVAHGTKFVYFQVDKQITLNQYTSILCSIHDVQLSNVSFDLSKLRFHSEIVCMGETFYQFVCKSKQNEGNRLLVRTKKKPTEKTQPLECIDKLRYWHFVWESYIQNKPKKK